MARPLPKSLHKEILRCGETKHPHACHCKQCHTCYTAGSLKATHFSGTKGTKSMTAVRLRVAEQIVHYLRQALAHVWNISKSEAESLVQVATLALLMMSGIGGMGGMGI